MPGRRGQDTTVGDGGLSVTLTFYKSPFATMTTPEGFYRPPGFPLL
jgi:hypothetical protein